MSSYATSASSRRSLTIVITGASRGLGAGMARTFLLQGHKLGLCSRSSPPPPEFSSATANNENIYYQSNVDVCDARAVQGFLTNVVQKFGTKTIDLWINNAGILDPIGPIRNTNYQDFERIVQVNLMGVFHCTKAYIQHARSAREKAVTSATATPITTTLVNISSRAAVKGYAGLAAYCSSKGAVDRLTECALLEEQEEEEEVSSSSSSNSNSSNSDYYFRAYSLAPGVIDTDMQDKIRRTSPNDFPWVDTFLKIKADDAFNTPPYVAQQIEALALLDGSQTLPVVQRLEPEKSRQTCTRTFKD